MITITKFVNRIGFSFFILLLSFSSSITAATLTFSPVSTTVQLGGSVDVEVSVSGLGNLIPSSVSAFDIATNFDPLLVNVSSVNYGSNLNNTDSLNSFVNTDLSSAGKAQFAEVSLLAGSVLDNIQLDRFVLATLSFDALALGITQLTFDLSGLGINGFGAGLFDSDVLASSLDVTIETGFIEIITPTTIPEPSTVFLLVFGIVSMRKFKTI